MTALSNRVLAFEGVLRHHHRKWAAAEKLLTTTEVELPVLTGQGSEYRKRFFQGAFLLPRVLMWVKKSQSPIGAGAGRVTVESDRRATEDPVWKKLPDRKAAVESQFVYPTVKTDHVLPFRTLPPGHIVLPLAGKRYLGTDPDLAKYPALQEWWTRAQEDWLANRTGVSKESGTTLDVRVNYKDGLADQAVRAGHRVVYNADGARLCAARLNGTSEMIEKSLYWAQASSEDEALYLLGVFNSQTFDEMVKPYQTIGNGGSRHFDMHIFEVGLPLYATADDTHRAIVDVARLCESKAAEVAPLKSHISGRGAVRKALEMSGLSMQLDELVQKILLA